MRAREPDPGERPASWILCFIQLGALLVVLGAVASEMRERPGARSRSTAAWFGGVAPHPQLGWTFAPGERLVAIYPDDPRGYFEREGPTRMLWRLAETDTTGRAVLSVEESTGLVHVRMVRTGTLPWSVQLTQGPLQLSPGGRIVVHLRVRGAHRDSIGVGLSHANAPWRNLGLYRSVWIDTSWTTVQDTVVVTAGDDSARLQVDVGRARSWVELRDVRLWTVGSGAQLSPDVTPRPVITYRFNRLGCRGAEPESASAAARRVLLLGDSYAMGAGVREHDMLGSLLTKRLLEDAGSTPAPAGVEVMTCAVPGWGTSEERQYYDLIRNRYAANLVVLVMTTNDEHRYRDEVSFGFVGPALRFERLAITWRAGSPLSQDSTTSAPGIAGELHALQQRVTLDGRRLAVVVLRDTRDEEGDEFARRVRSAMPSDVPFLDLGPAVAAAGDRAALLVHARVDSHPNEIVHRLAADSLFALIRREPLLAHDGGSSSAMPSRPAR